ncbi:uncharacterized protein LOC143195711 [Rhynchophorus ferrugineus]|uniref:uncharacterized protein LOC143195711 n=1 Tax=Rhynchophorus ferrugineus TaxID=354439 RepID=UPI003FCD4E8A
MIYENLKSSDSVVSEELITSSEQHIFSQIKSSNELLMIEPKQVRFPELVLSLTFFPCAAHLNGNRGCNKVRKENVLDDRNFLYGAAFSTNSASRSKTGTIWQQRFGLHSFIAVQFLIYIQLSQRTYKKSTL